VQLAAMMAGDLGTVTSSADVVVMVDRCEMRFLTESGRSASAVG
jgi:hypothetical protein